MGGNESTMKNKSTTNVTNDFMQKISTDVENRNEAELNLDQTLTFRAPFATMKNCSLRIDQNQKGTLRATMDAMASMTTEHMSESMIEAFEGVFKNWKPKERYTITEVI